MGKYIEKKVDITVKGNGTSLWGKSAGEFKVTDLELQGLDLDEDGWCWELKVFGPETVWTHYTDKQIEKEVNSKLKSIVSRAIGNKVKTIVWSEQGMQPDKGWSFDVILKGE